LAVAAGAELARTVLVHPVVGAALQHSADVEARNHRQHRVGRELDPALGDVAHQHHAGVDAVGLAGVDSVVNQHRHLAFGGPLVGVQPPFGADQHEVQRVVGVGGANFNQL